jgi:hypothetical protein
VAAVSGPDVDWRFGFRVPDGWVSVDLALPEHERAAELAAAVQGLVEAEPGYRADAERMTNAAVSIVADAVAHEAMVAAVGFELVSGAVAPMAVVAHRLPGEEPVDVDRLAASLGDAHGQDITGREVTVVELPAGRAVRVHAISEGGAPGGQSPVVEGVDHFIPVPGSPDLLLLSCTTPAVAIGDQLLPIFDTMASTVGFRPA